LSDPSSAKKVVEQTLAAFGRIDALLNIAGAVPQIDLFEMTDEQWDAGMALKQHNDQEYCASASGICWSRGLRSGSAAGTATRCPQFLLWPRNPRRSDCRIAEGSAGQVPRLPDRRHVERN
jgi:hypothetical protein